MKERTDKLVEDVDEGMTVMIELRAKLVQNGNKA